MVIQQGNDGALRELALFAGAGGGILGGKLLGWRTVCAVERDAYAAQILAQRQNDGILEPFPIWSDVTTFDGRPWRGIVDVVSGGFPCQDISVAGKGAGITGERSGMWTHMARIVGEVRPRHVFVENSPALLTRGLGVVLSDMAALGYDCKWTVLGAADVGAPHQRDRFWLLGHAPCFNGRAGRAWRPSHAGEGQRIAEREIQNTQVANTNRSYGEGNKRAERGIEKRAELIQPSWWTVEPDVGRVANGVAARVDRLKAIGNGQVSAVAARAFNLLARGY